jgi:2-hydroxy-3-keto-5-methylthiopentenyl-1-phosphate phosphatase
MTHDDLDRVLAVMDFDGTITVDDCMEVVLARHVSEWPRLMAAVHGGRLSQVDAFERAVELLKTPRQRVLNDFAHAAVLRRGSGEFLGWLLARRARAAVISAGFRPAIEAVWRREELPETPIVAAELAGDVETGLRMVFDERFGDCPLCGRGHCKADVVKSLRREGDFVVAFGDGSRDLCMAREADCVFARGDLARRCEREGMPYVPFEDFADMPQALLEQHRAHRRRY